jgi:hypothetical protein
MCRLAEEGKIVDREQKRIGEGRFMWIIIFRLGGFASNFADCDIGCTVYWASVAEDACLSQVSGGTGEG